MLSRICESFSCVPSVAIREWERDPDLITDILLMREYARIKHVMENGVTKDNVPKSELVMWWGENEIARMREQ